jgi:hypothetical protein
MADHLSREEFLAHVGYLREDIAGVHDRLDTLNGRTRKVESLTAVHSWAIGLMGFIGSAVLVWALSKF